MRIAIIGDKGYIGQNLTNWLEFKGYDVVGFDKTNCTGAEEIAYFNQVDCIVHLAAFPGMKNCKENIDRATIDNISSAYNVFRAAYNNGIKTPVIFTSSQAAKYPNDSLYGAIKRMIEIEADRYNNKWGDIRILRFTNVYGGLGYLEKKSTVIANIIKAIKEKKEFIINGDGSQKRDFIHVDDICKAIECTINSKPFRQPIDIGTGIETSIKDIVEMFKNKFNENFLFTFNLRSDMIGPMSSIADTKTAYDKLGFKYHVKLQDWIDSIEINK